MEKSYKLLMNLRADENVIKIIGFIKGRKKSEFFSKMLIEYLKDMPEEDFKEFINPIYEKEFYKIIKKLKEDNLNEEHKSKKINKKKITDNKDEDNFENDEF